MIAAVDIGGTKIAVGMVDQAGHVLVRLEQPTLAEQGPESGFERICTMLTEAAARVNQPLKGIGIGCTGPVDPSTGKLERIEFMPSWEGLRLTERLSERFGVTAAMENDADAAALGESSWGAGKGAGCFIYVTISTGIGAGIVLEGNLYRGVGGAHPEIGHHIIDPSGPTCACGARGCWESLASGLALARRSGYDSAREACAAAERGEERARTAVRDEGIFLGIGLANLVTIFTPDRIALGGGLMGSRELFWDSIQDSIRKYCGMVPNEKTKIVPAMLGKDTGLAGAARAWMNRYTGANGSNKMDK